MIPKNPGSMEIHEANASSVLGKLYEKGKGQSKALLVLSKKDNGEPVLLLKDANALTLFERISGAHKLDKIAEYLAQPKNVELAKKLSPFLNRRITSHNDKFFSLPYKYIKIVNGVVTLSVREAFNVFDDVKKSFKGASDLRLSLGALRLEKEKHRTLAKEFGKEEEFDNFSCEIEKGLLQTALSNDPDGVTFVLEWIASEISSGSTLDDIKNRLPLSSQDKKIVAFWHNYQRQNAGTISRDNIRQFDYVLGLVNSFGDIGCN